MSDGAPVPNNIEEKTKVLKEKTTGFLKKTLSYNKEPSSKRVVAFIAFLTGTIIGVIFSSFCVAMFVTPVLNNLDASKVSNLLPVLNAAVDFIKFFITATFAMAGGALGISGLEKFSERLTK